MRIFVTGGAGFIGSNFVCQALDQGHEIINIDKLTYAGNLDNLHGYMSHEKHHFHQEDICNTKKMEELIFKYQPDVVLHMAAESHVDRSIHCADEFIQTNISGTYSMVDVSLRYYKSLSVKEKFRFIHLSTDEVFGALSDEGKFDELTPYQPNSPYAASKAASDHIVRSYFKTYGLPIIIINSSNNYGPKQYPEKLIPLTITNILQGKNLPIYGSGKQVRDWLFVEDHVEALLQVVQGGKVGASYCIGADNEMSNIELVKLICSYLDECRPAEQPYSNLIKYVDDRLGHDFRYATDASKLKSDIGWTPKTNFEKGLKKTVDWYIEDYEKINCDSNLRKVVGALR